MKYSVESINDLKYTNELYEKAYNAMTPERRQKTDKLRFDEDRRLCIFSDMILRDMLKENFGIYTPEFKAEENGKPYLAGKEAHFNISHSKNFIACAVDSNPIGIDIEAVRPIHPHLLRRVCTRDELYFVTGSYSLPTAKDNLNEEESLRFLQVWTAKEAYIKYTGKGLGTELASFCVAESDKIKSRLTPDLKILNYTTPEYILSIVYESTQQITDTKENHI